VAVRAVTRVQLLQLSLIQTEWLFNKDRLAVLYRQTNMIEVLMMTRDGEDGIDIWIFENGLLIRG
jgi:hypothetical protein